MPQRPPGADVNAVQRIILILKALGRFCRHHQILQFNCHAMGGSSDDLPCRSALCGRMRQIMQALNSGRLPRNNGMMSSAQTATSSTSDSAPLHWTIPTLVTISIIPSVAHPTISAGAHPQRKAKFSKVQNTRAGKAIASSLSKVS
jgi:hypothetical protein